MINICKHGGNTKTSIFIMVVLFVLCGIAGANCLHAEVFEQSIGPGEILQFGDYIISENGKFKMGFNEQTGVLEIKDIGLEPLSSHQRIYWYPSYTSAGCILNSDGKTVKEFLVDFNLDRSKTGASPIGFFNDNTWHDSEDRSATARSLEVKCGFIYMKNSSGGVIWHTEPKHPWRNYFPHSYSSQSDSSDIEAYLCLENNGRAKLIGMIGSTINLLWCSCNYCYTTSPIQLDFFARNDYIKNGSFARAKAVTGGMLTHEESLKYFSHINKADTYSYRSSSSLCNGSIVSDADLFLQAKTRCKAKK